MIIQYTETEESHPDTLSGSTHTFLLLVRALAAIAFSGLMYAALGLTSLGIDLWNTRSVLIRDRRLAGRF